MTDPERQFWVEVDSNVGVGPVVSQTVAPDQKLHPCTPNSPATLDYREPRRLSSAASGGPPWERTPEALSTPVLPATNTSPSSRLLLVSCNHCRFLIAPLVPHLYGFSSKVLPPSSTDGGRQLQQDGSLPAISQAPIGHADCPAAADPRRAAPRHPGERGL